MFALFSLFIIVALSMLITKIITIALIHTGISKEIAQFQAVSAFTGAGFTSTESESIINHPVRRRIILNTTRLGSIGVVTLISSVVLTFVEAGQSQEWFTRIVLLAIGIGLLWLVTLSKAVDNALSRWITLALERWTDIDVSDYASLLNINEDYRIGEMLVEPEDWLTGRQLKELQLTREGILVLGIHEADGDFVGTPIGEIRIHAGDRLILYGRGEQLVDLSNRRSGLSGFLAHQEAITEQLEIIEELVQHVVEPEPAKQTDGLNTTALSAQSSP